MDVILISCGLAGLGYFLNKNGEKNDDDKQLPSQGDGYTTDYFWFEKTEYRSAHHWS